jgi:DNA polymerase-3 subunit chi
MVEIGHSVPKGRRSVLINLNAKVPNFANQFQYIVDFVPSNAELKQQARERFKTCRQWGFSVDNQKAVDPNKASQ